MADQFNDSIPAVTNQITEDIADIAETLGYIKDVFQNFCYNWSNTVATQVFPNKMNDDDEVLINIAGSEVISINAAGYDVLSVPQGLDVTAAIHRKIVNIGDWNMDTTATLDVAHGVTLSKIRNVSVQIIDDSSASISSLELTQTIANVVYNAGSFYCDATNVKLSRTASGNYDSASYNATSFNRGWIIVEYVD